MAQERKGAVTFQGNPLTLVGPEIRVGDKAPGFTVLSTSLSPVHLSDSAGKVRILSSVPSLDTPVCDMETRRFNEEAARIPGVEILTLSTDLPFAQARWCAAAGIDKVKTLSDHKDLSFGIAYGVVIQELRLLARAVFVVDAKDQVRYVETVKEITSEPNYAAAIQAARAAAAG